MKKVYFPQHGGVATEQNLVQDLVDEQIKLFGSDVFYIPRVHLKDKTLGEVIQSEFKQSYMIEMFLVNVEGFGAGAEFVSKFGLRITDEITFVVSRRRWEQSANPALSLAVDGRPNEGDLIYFPLTEDLYEVKYVERENPFFQLGKQYFYQLTAEIYEQGADKFDTGIDEIDDVERQFSNITTLNLSLTTRQTATGTLEVDSSGAISQATVTLAGTGYNTPPNVTNGNAGNGSGGIITTSILDGGVVILDAVSGVQSQTMTVWRQANHVNIPRFAFVNKMDRDGSSMERVENSIRNRLGVKPITIQMPIGEEKDFHGVIDLLSLNMYTWNDNDENKNNNEDDDGSTYTISKLQPDHILYNDAINARETLIEDITEFDDELADLYLTRMDDDDNNNNENQWKHDDEYTSIISDIELWDALQRIVLNPKSGALIVQCGAALR